MTDSDQSSAAATRPHRPSGDEENNKLSFWAKLRAFLALRSPSLREDLAEALEDKAGDNAGFSDNERAILQNVLKLRSVQIEDVMVPRADIEAVEAGDTMATLLARFREVGHSRLPVYDDNLDNIVGFVHIKDALQRFTAVNGSETDEEDKNPVKLLTPVLKQKVRNKDMVRKLLFVPPSMPVSDLLQSMQTTRVHMAMVVDEYGGTDGLVTIEDLLETVVGDIEDEHDDDDDELIKKVTDDVFVADARVELTEVIEIVGADFDPGIHGEDVDTLGGLIFDLVDRVPVRGEVITRLKGFEFQIVQADPRRIRRVRILRRKRPVRARSIKPKSTPAAPSSISE